VKIVRKLLVGLCILAIPSLLMISPVLAAQVVYHETIHNQLIVSTFADTVCGVTDTFTANLIIRLLDFTVWSDGHSVVTVINQLRIVDSAGNVIAISTFTNHDIEGQGGLPFTFEFTQTVTCTGASATPGLLTTGSFGSTIGLDGTLIEVHVQFHP
jgi:hypothetical protein